MIGSVSPWALAGAEWGGPIPPRGITSYHLYQGGRIHFEKCSISDITNPADTCKQSSRLYIPDLCSCYRDQPWQPHRRAQPAGYSATCNGYLDKDDFSIIQFFVQKVYVVELTNISHCLLIVRCQRWLELDEPNWEATWAGAGWRTSDELEFFSESAKDCSLFVIFYLLSTDELAYLRQSTVEHFVTYET